MCVAVKSCCWVSHCKDKTLKRRYLCDECALLLTPVSAAVCLLYTLHFQQSLVRSVSNVTIIYSLLPGSLSNAPLSDSIPCPVATMSTCRVQESQWMYHRTCHWEQDHRKRVQTLEREVPLHWLFLHRLQESRSLSMSLLGSALPATHQHLLNVVLWSITSYAIEVHGHLFLPLNGT